MFARKLWTESTIRVVLITVILFNALTPVSAIVMSIPGNQTENIPSSSMAAYGI